MDRRVAIAVIALVGLSSACVASSRPELATNASCDELANTQIPGAAIGLPTTGAIVTATQMIASAVGKYCLASGNIMPVDVTAPNIQFQVALPTNWNAKVVMLGGGGFDGTIPNVAGNMQNTPADALSPLSRGYAVFASDSGHQSSALPHDAAFALNQES